MLNLLLFKKHIIRKLFFRVLFCLQYNENSKQYSKYLLYSKFYFSINGFRRFHLFLTLLFNNRIINKYMLYTYNYYDLLSLYSTSSKSNYTSCIYDMFTKYEIMIFGRCSHRNIVSIINDDCIGTHVILQIATDILTV